MTTNVLDRDLTNDALVAYLAADEKLQPLASCLADASVDSNVLMDAIQQQRSGSPAALLAYFIAEVPRGAVGTLAQRMHTLVQAEAEAASKAKKQRKQERSDEKREQLTDVRLVTSKIRQRRGAALARCQHVRRETIFQLLQPLRERAAAAAAICARGYQHDERRRGVEHGFR